MVAKQPSLAELINNLFRLYPHPEGREYTHKEVEGAITAIAGKRLIEASYLSRVRNNLIKRPSLASIEALCYFFPVETDYFFPNVVALRKRQTGQPKADQLRVALRAAGTDPEVFRTQLEAILHALNVPGDGHDESRSQGE